MSPLELRVRGPTIPTRGRASRSDASASSAPGLERGVGVQEQDERSARLAHALVAGAREADVLRVGDDAHAAGSARGRPRVSRHGWRCRRPPSRSRSRRSLSSAVEPGEERVASLERDDDDRDCRSLAHRPAASSERLAREARGLGPGVPGSQRAAGGDEPRAHRRVAERRDRARGRRRPRRGSPRAARPRGRSRPATGRVQPPAAGRARPPRARAGRSPRTRRGRRTRPRPSSAARARDPRRSRTGARWRRGPARRRCASRSRRGWVRFSPTTSSTRPGCRSRRRTTARSSSGRQRRLRIAPTLSRSGPLTPSSARASARGGGAGRSSSAASGMCTARSARSGKRRASSRAVKSEQTATRREARSDARDERPPPQRVERA